MLTSIKSRLSRTGIVKGINWENICVSYHEKLPIRDFCSSQLSSQYSSSSLENGITDTKVEDAKEYMIFKFNFKHPSLSPSFSIS